MTFDPGGSLLESMLSNLVERTATARTPTADLIAAAENKVTAANRNLYEIARDVVEGRGPVSWLAGAMKAVDNAKAELVEVLKADNAKA